MQTPGRCSVYIWLDHTWVVDIKSKLLLAIVLSTHVDILDHFFYIYINKYIYIYANPERLKVVRLLGCVNNARASTLLLPLEKNATAHLRLWRPLRRRSSGGCLRHGRRRDFTQQHGIENTMYLALFFTRKKEHKNIDITYRYRYTSCNECKIA